MATRADVFAALAKKSNFEVVNDSETETQLRFNGRSQRNSWPFFLPVIFVLLKASNTPGNQWTCDISKQYILDKGRVLYAWRFIFQSSAGIAQHYETIVNVIRSAARPARVEIQEQLLPGHKPGQVRGGVNAKGKGAAPAGTPVLAVTRRT